jgi:hypothetical protein
MQASKNEHFFLAILLRTFGFIAPKTLSNLLLNLSILSYSMKVIPETRRAN